MGKLIDDLVKLLEEHNLVVTFDIFRDSTKGCGKHCLAWERGHGTTYCVNHQAAIDRGEYTPKVVKVPHEHEQDKTQKET